MVPTTVPTVTIHTHSWKAATCTASKTCTTCGATEGVAKGHQWEAATCAAPKTCAACGATEGTAKAHSWLPATCTYPKRCTGCPATEGKPTGHNWIDNVCTAPKTCSNCGKTEGEPKGHNWLEATCTHSKMCSNCGVTVGDSLDHNWTFKACEAYMVCTRCNSVGGQYVRHKWKDNVCEVCQQHYCGYYGHDFFYNRCYECSAFDEESTAQAKKILPAVITEGMSEYEKVKAIHDYIAGNTKYDRENLENDTIPDSSYSPLGVFVHGTAVCQGYAYAFELLCDLAGVDCVLVTGTADGGGHAWNQVKVDGKWYNIDVTWDDPIYTFNGVPMDIICYDYFLISDSQMYKDHIAEDAKYICNESYQ